MDKVWKPTESKSDKLILIHERSIYKGSPDRDQMKNLDSEVQRAEVIKGLFGIPYSYIKKIINQKGINHIKIFFGKDSEEELYIDNENLKDEIFDFLKSDIQGLAYKSETPNMVKYAKVQLFSILISTGLFVWAMYLAIQISNGVEYELVGNGRPGLTGFVLLFANLGITKLIIGYSIITGIALFSLFRKLKTRTEMQILER